VVVMNCHVQQKVKVGKTVCERLTVTSSSLSFYLFTCNIMRCK